MRFLLDHDVPEDLIHLLRHLGHEAILLRQALPEQTPDQNVLQFAFQNGYLLLTCNRDDFLELAAQQPHHGIVIIIRRRTRAAERAALLRLLARAGSGGLRDNINFA